MKRAIALFGVALAVFGFAQEPQFSAVPEKELKAVEWMSWNWEGPLTMDMGTGKTTLKAYSRGSLTLGGRYIEQNYGMTSKEMSMSGKHLLTYDATQKKYVGWWFDSMESGMMEMSGSYSHGTLALISKPTVMGGMPDPVVMRAIYHKINDRNMEFKLDMKQGDAWINVISATYKRAKK